jgi:hypothetical protein
VDLDLTGRMVGITMTDSNLKSALGLHPEFRLRPGAIYQLYGKVLGHAPVGIWLELYWVGLPTPPGGVRHLEPNVRQPAFLVQWPWAITTTLHPETSDTDAWLRRQLEGFGLGEPPS